ncbi:MAG: tripartite tricarboxylate transporter TctB family protein [Aestuariivita sp.]|nr:tripartite tricarboxylate transporter TctB family protein [Aestuariivita sp.]MCY4201532.1 tripartite tricarboxylate transporter TctB family protein [Aestuariivita sp.]
MALDRWIALIMLGICLTYGYTAWFTMDAGLAPFMRQNPVWPSSFPKLLSIASVLVLFFILCGFEKNEQKALDVDYRRLHEYRLGPAAALLSLMVAYALCLRPLGFLFSTAGFLIIGSFILGERKWHIMVPVSLITAAVVWYLIQKVLGIYLRPLPGLLGN